MSLRFHAQVVLEVKTLTCKSIFAIVIIATAVLSPARLNWNGGIVFLLRTSELGGERERRDGEKF